MEAGLSDRRPSGRMAWLALIFLACPGCARVQSTTVLVPRVQTPSGTSTDVPSGPSGQSPPTPFLVKGAKAPVPAPDPFPARAVADLGTRKQGSDWPGFLGPEGTSVSPEKGILSPWPKEGLRLVWQKQVGTGYGMPSISRGRLFQFDRHGKQARLTCLKSETGEFLWQFEYPTEFEDFYHYNNGPRCCPVVDDDRVYIHGADSMLCCLAVEDGRLLWKHDTAAEFGIVQNFFGVGSTPVIEGDLLIAQIGGSPPDSGRFPYQGQKGNGSGVVAFDKRTGKIRYQVTDALASYAGPVLATIGGRRWCFVFARGGLVGLEPATGKVRFDYPYRAPILESVNASNPVVVGDQVFISETYGPGGSLLRIKPDGCEEIWSDASKRRNKSMQCHWSTPIYHDGYLYGCSGRHENADLRCIEWATGKVLWTKPDLTRTSLLMVDGHLVCLAEDGHLLLLKVNPQKYEEVSRLDGLPLEYPCWAAPILAHGLLYVRDKEHLYCLELIPEKKK
jgi:outer membrane protein assembly factor BamB